MYVSRIGFSEIQTEKEFSAQAVRNAFGINTSGRKRKEIRLDNGRSYAITLNASADLMCGFGVGMALYIFSH